MKNNILVAFLCMHFVPLALFAAETSTGENSDAKFLKQWASNYRKKMNPEGQKKFDILFKEVELENLIKGIEMPNKYNRLGKFKTLLPCDWPLKETIYFTEKILKEKIEIIPLCKDSPKSNICARKLYEIGKKLGVPPDCLIRKYIDSADQSLSLFAKKNYEQEANADDEKCDETIITSGAKKLKDITINFKADRLDWIVEK